MPTGSGQSQWPEGTPLRREENPGGGQALTRALRAPWCTVTASTGPLPEALSPSLWQILVWGLRNMKQVRSPQLLVECWEETRQTEPIRDFKSNPNFAQSVLFLTLVRRPRQGLGSPLLKRGLTGPLWAAVHAHGGGLRAAPRVEGGGQ